MRKSGRLVTRHTTRLSEEVHTALSKTLDESQEECREVAANGSWGGELGWNTNPLSEEVHTRTKL